LGLRKIMSKHFKWRKPKAAKEQPSAEQENAGRQKETQNTRIYVEGGIEIDLVKSLKKQYEADQDRTKTHNKKQLLWTKITAGLVFVYAGLTFWQACETNSIRSIAHQQLVDSQRPWLGAGQIVAHEKLDVGSLVPTSIEVVNTGNNPAIHASTILQLSAYCGGLPQHLYYEAQREENTSYSIFMPHESAWVGPDTLVSPITADQMTKLRAADGSCKLYAYATLRYRDSFGGHHWQHLCWYWYVPTPKTFTVCSVYTDGDYDYKDGKEP
jgi:hypothetical protein